MKNVKPGRLRLSGWNRVCLRFYVVQAQPQWNSSPTNTFLLSFLLTYSLTLSFLQSSILSAQDRIQQVLDSTSTAIHYIYLWNELLNSSYCNNLVQDLFIFNIISSLGYLLTTTAFRQNQRLYTQLEIRLTTPDNAFLPQYPFIYSLCTSGDCKYHKPINCLQQLAHVMQQILRRDYSSGCP